MLFSIGICIVLLFAIPYIIGCTIDKNSSFFESYLIGFSVEMGIFLVLCIPMNLLQIDFDKLCLSYSIILVWLVVGALIIKKSWRTEKSSKKFTFILGLAIGMILYQIIRTLLFMPYIDGDDCAYISMVNDIKSTNVIHGLDYLTGISIPVVNVALKYRLTAYYPFLAYISKISGLHPLILCKTILPIFYMAMGYMTVWLIAKRLFANQKREEMFFLIYVVLIEVGNYSYYTISRRMLMWSWNSKSVLFTILLPALFYFSNKFFDEKMKVRSYIILMSIVAACCSATLMGAGMAPLLLLSVALVYAVIQKRFLVLIQALLCCIPAMVIVGMDLMYSLR